MRFEKVHIATKEVIVAERGLRATCWVFHKKGCRTQVNSECILIDMTLEAPVCHLWSGVSPPLSEVYGPGGEGWGG